MLAFVGLGGWAMLRPAAGAKPEKRDRPRCREEEVAQKWITDHAHDPASVEFDTWGPHDLQGELGLTWQPRSLLARMLELGGLKGGEKPRPAKIIRVLLRAKNQFGAKQLQDYLLLLQDDKVVAAYHNKWEDDWKKPMKEQQDLLDKLLLKIDDLFLDMPTD
jgi:hypothetical protein